jgi:hypothetical protein
MERRKFNEIFVKTAGGLFIAQLFPGCKSITGPDNTFVQVTITIEYERLMVNDPGSLQEPPRLETRILTPSGWDPSNPEAYNMRPMTQTGENLFRADNVVVFKTGQNVFSVGDLAMGNGTSNSCQYVGKNLYVTYKDQRHLLAKTDSMGSAEWCGLCKFTIKSDDSIVQP